MKRDTPPRAKGDNNTCGCTCKCATYSVGNAICGMCLKGNHLR